MEFKIEPLELTNSVLKSLILYMSKFFDLEDLEMLVSKVVSVDFIKRRPVDNSRVVLYKAYSKTKTMTIWDNLDLDHFPSRRWIEIEFNDSGSYKHQVFFYRYTNYLYHYITSAFAFAYNIKKYCDNIMNEDYETYKLLVLNRYSNLLYIFISKLNNAESIYKDLLNLVHSFEFDKKIMNHHYTSYFKSLQLQDGISIECVSITYDALKFQISTNSDRMCLYVNRNIIGMNNLVIALENSYLEFAKNKG